MSGSKDPVKIEISARTIIFAVFFLLGLKVLWMVRSLLMSLFIAFMVMSVLKPVVWRLERRGIPRTLSALVIFVTLIIVFGYGLVLLIPSLASDMASLARTLPSLLATLPPQVREYVNIDAVTRYAPSITNQAFSVITGLFSNVVFVITTIFFSFYFTVEENFVKNFLVKFFHETRAQRVAEVFDRTEKRMSAWFWGELILMTVVGIMTYIGLSLIGVPHALSLAVLAGLLEIIPVVGPLISAIPAVVFALPVSTFLAISTGALYVVIQQLENNILVPMVMKRAVGLNKIVILMVLIMGGQLGGFAGVFLAIPLTLFIETIVTDVVHGRRAATS